jgi:hypothetical protein
MAPRANTAEVDTPTEVAETTEAKPTSTPRAALGEGFISPIQFRNKLVELGKVGDDFRPQVIYSYIKNKSKNDPFPTHESNGRVAIKLEEGLEWWDRKEARKVERKTNAEAKAAKAAEKAAEAPAEAEAEAGEVTEAE